MTPPHPYTFRELRDDTSRRRELSLQKGEVEEAVRAIKKLYLEVVGQITDHLKTEDSASAGQ